MINWGVICITMVTHVNNFSLMNTPLANKWIVHIYIFNDTINANRQNVCTLMLLSANKTYHITH